LLADAPWSTWPVTVSVPVLVPLTICGEMLALEALLNPWKPSVMALSIEGSIPRYAFFASSDELTPEHPSRTTKSKRLESRIPGIVPAQRAHTKPILVCAFVMGMRRKY